MCASSIQSLVVFPRNLLIHSLLHTLSSLKTTKYHHPPQHTNGTNPILNPTKILPKSYTHIISGILFFYFGIKLMYNSRSMENKVSDELGEVEEELLSISRRRILLMIVVVVRGGWWGVDRHQACCRGI